MCTLSFLPVEGGFHLLMNRDEQRSRPAAFPPRLHPCGNLRAIYPSEQGGGTWIGTNEAGLTAALINWYSRPRLSGQAAFSRGLIIPTLLSSESSAVASLLMRSLPLHHLDPFRLFLFEATTRTITFISSDGKHLEAVDLPWERRHWFSSGYDEPEATRLRGLTCENSDKESDAGTLPWLRRLHRSHDPAEGPFSLCMHREDACTVSMTEVCLSKAKAELTYHSGSPCQESDGARLGISLRKR
jgi:hypothetical protein